jgi:acetamidase/formamidase
LTLHELPLEQGNLHGHFSRDLEPVLEIEPGDSVRFTTPNHAWDLARDEHLAPPNPEVDQGHALAGPILVRGARAGGTLSVRIEEVVPASWGETLTEWPHRIAWELADGVGRWQGREVDLRPFLGVLGMPPPEPGVHSTGPPRRSGGNIDCALLVAGSTLYLPIPVDGALFSAGDGHARQGDGEVSGTAIECASEATLTLELVDGPALEWPIARVEGAWAAFGFDADLDVAARIATDGVVALVAREHGVSLDDALALASVVADLRVTQVVNGVKGVHAVLADGAIR